MKTDRREPTRIREWLVVIAQVLVLVWFVASTIIAMWWLRGCCDTATHRMGDVDGTEYRYMKEYVPDTIFVSF